MQRDLLLLLGVDFLNVVLPLLLKLTYLGNVLLIASAFSSNSITCAILTLQESLVSSMPPYISEHEVFDMLSIFSFYRFTRGL